MALAGDLAEETHLTIGGDIDGYGHDALHVGHAGTAALHAVGTLIRIVRGDGPWVTLVKLPIKLGEIAGLETFRKRVRIDDYFFPMHPHDLAQGICRVRIIVGEYLKLDWIEVGDDGGVLGDGECQGFGGGDLGIIDGPVDEVVARVGCGDEGAGGTITIGIRACDGTSLRWVGCGGNGIESYDRGETPHLAEHTVGTAVVASSNLPVIGGAGVERFVEEVLDI